ncbi:MAG: tetratricopeptide repeat protein, partial [Chloroflexi bacterium]|nr:tetratricopeptide repeat protein [Chloroflexota bacterium]
QPWYRGSCGIAGLRGIPAGGKVPENLPMGLMVWGRALKQRQAQGWLHERVVREEFLSIARITEAAYPFPDIWLNFWRSQKHEGASEFNSWLNALHPVLGQKGQNKRQSSIQANPDWARRARALDQRMESRDLKLLQELDSLLTEQLHYAQRSGDGDPLARAVSKVFKTLLNWQPEWLLPWAKQACQWAPENKFTWTVTGRLYLQIGGFDEALDCYIEAGQRFPDNVVARTGLGEVLKAQNRLDEAEKQYRDTIERFPDNVIARTGLAEILKAQNRPDKAEKHYRDTIKRFPDNVVARNGLGEVLKAQDRLEEAEKHYRDTIERFPRDVVACNGLGEVLKTQNRPEEAEKQYRATIERFPDDVVARTGLAEVLKAQNRPEDAEKQYRNTIERFPDNVVARTGLAEVLKAQDRLDEAEKQYRSTVEAFPDDVFARSGLKRSLKAQGKTEEAEALLQQTTDVGAACLIIPSHSEEHVSMTSDHESRPLSEHTEKKEHHLNAAEIHILIRDAWLMRSYLDGKTPAGEVRDKAYTLLEKLRMAMDDDPRAVFAGALLEQSQETQDALKDADQLLTRALHRFPGQWALLYTRNQIRSQALQMDSPPVSAEQLIMDWRRLAKRDSRLFGLCTLGEAKILLADESNESAAKDILGQLGHFINLDRSDGPLKRWANKVSEILFSGKAPRMADEIKDLSPYRDRMKKYGKQLERITDLFIEAISSIASPTTGIRLSY